MYFVKKLCARKARRRDYAGISELAMLEIPLLIVVSLVYLCGAVAASDVISASSLLPSRSSSSDNNFRSLSSFSSPSSSSSAALSSSDADSTKHPHHHHHQYHSAPHHQPQMESPPPAEAYSPSWYNAHMNDPRMGFFFSNSASAPVAAASPTAVVAPPHPPQKSARLVARPRSLSGFTTMSSSFPAGDKKKKKRKKVKKTKEIRPRPESNSSAQDPEPVASPSTDLTIRREPESSRTFLLTPFLAYLVPVFIAQMFGMGMIPAAALITLPIFLLPLGLTAAVFLI